jgi:hypothetical protein
MAEADGFALQQPTRRLLVQYANIVLSSVPNSTPLLADEVIE